MTLIVAKRHELMNYRTEILRRLDAQDAHLRRLGGKPSTALRTQIEARFKHVTDTLDVMTSALIRRRGWRQPALHSK